MLLLVTSVPPRDLSVLEISAWLGGETATTGERRARPLEPHQRHPCPLRLPLGQVHGPFPSLGEPTSETYRSPRALHHFTACTTCTSLIPANTMMPTPPHFPYATGAL